MATSKSTRKSTRKATQRNAAAQADFEKFAATIEDEEIASSGGLSLMAWIASLCKESAHEEMARIDAEIRYHPSAA